MLDVGTKLLIRKPFTGRVWKRGKGKARKLTIGSLSPTTGSGLSGHTTARVDHACQAFCRVSWKPHMFKGRRSAVVNLNEIHFEVEEEGCV